LEFLDIDYNTWSLIIFFSQVVLTFSISLFLIFGTFRALMFLFFVWIISQLMFLFYGMLKELDGFILLFAFNILVTFMTIAINSGKTSEENEEDE